MIDSQIVILLQSQIAAEFSAANFYFNLSSVCNSLNFKGFSHYFLQAGCEEQAHAKKIIEYLFLNEQPVDIRDIQTKEIAMPISIPDVFNSALEAEIEITERINTIMLAAVNLTDFATQNFLMWFIDEQKKAVAEAKFLARRVLDLSDNFAALCDLDHEVGEDEI